MGSQATTAKLGKRVERAGEEALRRQDQVSAIDILVLLQWLPRSAVDRWQQGRIDHLELAIQVGDDKRDHALALFEQWATDGHLVPTETDYLARARDHHPLRFTEDGDPERERRYRTHWMSPSLTPAKREKLVEKQSKAPELVVVMPVKDWSCDECGETGDFLFMEGDGPLCLSCADLDHLVFLPRGDAALTRRSKKKSTLSAVVIRWSRSRKRYERQGLLAEPVALQEAELECLADHDLRARKQERDAARRDGQDQDFIDAFAAELRTMFPGMPEGRAGAIAAHAGLRGSGRVGRSAAGRSFDENALMLAVMASVRHEDTDYDDLLMTGVSRIDARNAVRDQAHAILERWRTPPS